MMIAGKNNGVLNSDKTALPFIQAYRRTAFKRGIRSD